MWKQESFFWWSCKVCNWKLKQYLSHLCEEELLDREDYLAGSRTHNESRKGKINELVLWQVEVSGFPKVIPLPTKVFCCSKKQILNITVYEYLNLKWFNLPQWNETFHKRVLEEKLVVLNIPAWDKARVLQGTDESDPASAHEVWIKMLEN